jgi:hypothetical protein
MILSVISWYRLVLSEKDLWAGAGWDMGGLRDGRAKAFLSRVARVTGRALPFSSSFPGASALSPSAPPKAAAYRQLRRQLG